jgi:fructose-bisphosphate aldolase class I
VTSATLATVFDHLFAANVFLEGIVLKPNMIVPGKKSGQKVTPEQVAEATVRVLKRHVPSAVPGIAFLSGGQSSVDATHHLQLINAMGPLPWPVTFSYGRALQDNALVAWSGHASSFGQGQAALFKRAKLNGLASVGAYNGALENSAA